MVKEINPAKALNLVNLANLVNLLNQVSLDKMIKVLRGHKMDRNVRRNFRISVKVKIKYTLVNK